MNGFMDGLSIMSDMFFHKAKLILVLLILIKHFDELKD